MAMAERWTRTNRPTHGFRIVMLVGLVLLLQIPIFAIDALIRERQGRRSEAVEEIASKWGRRQVVAGPALIVPYTHRWRETTDKGASVQRQAIEFATFLPERVSFQGRL